MVFKVELFFPFHSVFGLIMVFKVELFFPFHSVFGLWSLVCSFYLILFCSYVFLFVLSFVCMLPSVQRLELMNKLGKFKVISQEADNKSHVVSIQLFYHYKCSLTQN